MRHGETSNSLLCLDELQAITIWASTLHFPKRYNNYPINEYCSISVLIDTPVYSNKEIWSILSCKLNFRELDGKIYAPGFFNRTDISLKHGVELFYPLEELGNRVRYYGHRLYYFGRERKMLTDHITDEEYVGLILWASLAPLPVYYIPENLTKIKK